MNYFNPLMPSVPDSTIVNPYEEQKAQLVNQIFTDDSGRIQLVNFSNRSPQSIRIFMRYLDVMGHHYPNEVHGYQEIINTFTVHEYALLMGILKDC